MFSLLVLAIQVLPAMSAGDDAHGHGGDDAFEWAGIFETPEDTYLWTAQKTKTDSGMMYADATMKMAVLPASDATEAALHGLEGEGGHSLNMTCTEVLSGGTITPMEDKCYLLRFKQDWWQSLYTIDATGQAHLAFFTEHVPTEFENGDHYLKDDHGDDIEPVAELPEEAAAAAVEKEKHWGPAVGTAIIVNVITLIGVIFLVPGLSAARKNYATEFDCLTGAFAAGAISSCAFFLLLFESTHLVATGWDKEVDQIWRWGTMILAGALFPVVVQLVAEVITGAKPHDHGEAAANADKGDTDVALPATRVRIISSILIGDSMHNLVDGFFIGAAFEGCGSSFGWAVAGSTIAHELAQELSDYVVLTGKGCKLHPAVALALNFLSGTGVLLGVIIVLSADIADSNIGLLLAFGGGAYLYIAFIECMPRLMTAKVSAAVRAAGVFTFILGAVAIGLVLLDHEHCVPPAEPGAPASAHAGHNH